MRFSVFVAISVAACLEAVSANPVTVPDDNEASLSTPEGETKTKPRCLQTLFGYWAKDKLVGAMDSLGGPSDVISDLPLQPGFGGGQQPLQGGIVTGPSQFTPGGGGLPSHAFDAVNNAQNMNSQLSGLNSQLHPQFSGAGGGTGYGYGGYGGAGAGQNIPMSPIQFRHGMQSFSTGINEGPTPFVLQLQQPMVQYY